MDEAVVSQSDSASSVADLTRETFSELSADSQPASETTQETAQPTTPADATVPQDAQVQETSAQENAETEQTASGIIPLERHKAVLEGERAKRTEIEQRLQTVEQSIVAPMQRDPVGWLVESFAEVLNDPRYNADPRLKSFAGRQLRGGPTATEQAAAADAPPQLQPLVDGHGNKVYAAEDVEALVDWRIKQALGQVEQTISPIKQKHEQAEKLAQAREVISKVTTNAKTLMERYRKAPGWTPEIEPQVKAKYAEHLQAGHGPSDALAFAYQDVVVPTLSQRERQAVVSSLHAKTQATTISPSAPVTTPAKKGPVSIRDLAREALAEAGAL